MKYIKNKKYSKLLIVLLIVIGISSSFLMFKSYGYQDKELPKVRLKNETKNKTFAIMLEDNYQDGNYTEYESDTFPTDGYTFNGEKSKCTDTNGNIVKDVLSYDSENKLITLNTNKTVYCYIYYDRTMFFGSGTEKSPYQINHIEDLVRLSNSVNNGDSYSGKYFELTQNLDFKEKDSYENSERTDFGDINGVSQTETLINELTNTEGSGFKPIGNATLKFQGNINGNNKKISNLHISINDTSSSNLNIGFIGYAENNEIKNLNVQGKIYVKVNANIGLIGATNDVLIDNCISEIEITSDGKLSSGGIVGGSYGNITITDCINKGKITNNDNVGGILGWLTNDKKAVIERCKNEAKLINEVGQSIGGLVGRDSNGNSTININDSSNEGDITGINYIGGLAGKLNGKINIENSNNSGKVYNEKGTEAFGIGGLIGELLTSTNSNKIYNSYNIGDVIDNPPNTRWVLLGGLVGRNWSSLIIENCYNKGTIAKEGTLNLKNNQIDIGGLIGVTRENSINKIVNSYNEGNIIDGNRQGGLIGFCHYSTQYIYNSYNLGDITSYIDSENINLCLGGLIGWSSNSSENIINCYNLGLVVANGIGTAGNNYLSGLIGAAGDSKIINIINSFNKGQVGVNNTKLNSYSFGISNLFGTLNINVENFYNLGDLNGNVKNELLYSYGATVNYNINNAYYRENLVGSNINGIGTAIASLNTQAFVDTLNNNMYKIDLASIDESLKGYKLNGWVLGLDGYPIFAKNIKDLSGQGNDGISFAASWTDEGITTSTSDKIGYVYGGLENHDFGEDLTFVIRLKFNDIEKEQYILSNQEGAGGAFIYRNQYIRLTLYGQDLPTPGYMATPYSKTKLNADTWYTIVGTYDSKVGKEILYINGGEEASQALTGRIKPSVVFIGIGQNPYKNLSTITSPTYATYSDVLIFDRALTSDEIKENYSNVPNPVNKNELLLWYKFN